MTRALQWRIALGLVLVFLAGAATGLFAGAWHARRAFSERHGRMMGERMRTHLEEALDLTPAQLQEVDPILRDMTQRLQTIRAETGQRVAQTMEESHRELARHLTPEQMEKLEEMRKRHERKPLRRRAARHRPPPPAGHVEH